MIQTQINLHELFKSWILIRGLYRQSIIHPTLPTDALTLNFNDLIIARRNKVDLMNTKWAFRSLQMLKPVLSSLALNGGYVLFGTSSDKYNDMMGYAAAYCDMPHISDVWKGGALTNGLQLKKCVDLIFIADISADYAIYIEAQTLKLPSVFMHHFNSRFLPTYSLPGPITWESVYFYANVLAYFVKAVFFRKEILSQKVHRQKLWLNTIVSKNKQIKCNAFSETQRIILGKQNPVQTSLASSLTCFVPESKSPYF